MYGPLLRKHLAKMISQFAIKVVGLAPDPSRDCLHDDVSEESDEMQHFIRIGCELGLMGLQYDGEPAETFWPNEIVTRAQFGTVFSRLLWSGENNGDAEVRYRPHLNALNVNEIMKLISIPSMKELRGYVMLMMMRADQKNLVEYTRSTIDR